MERDWAVLGWKMLVTRGVLAIVFGLVAMFWPTGTVIALALLWGIWALIDGIGSIWQAFRPEAKGQGRAWLIVMGVIAVLAGLLVIIHPGIAVAALTWILGIWLIIRGVIELVGAFSSTITVPRWLLVVSGALSLVLGVLFVVNPETGAVAIAFWLGLVALIWGVVFLGLGLAVRSHLNAFAGPGGPPGAVA
ncbi:MAG: HdeD family acid-resistance protein [Dermatophilaceae bacterium]